MKVNATLKEVSGGTDTPLVTMTFQIPKEELVGLEYSGLEFTLDIKPKEK